MATKKQTTELNISAPKVNLHIPDNLPMILVDGVTHVNLAYPVAKITFHANLMPGASAADGIEQRRAVLQLNIPPHVLVDFCRNVLAGSIANKKEISDAAEKSHKAFLTVIDGLAITPTPRVENIGTKNTD